MNHEHHTVIAVNDTVIDSDYGVFIPHSLSDLQEKLYLIPFYYRNFRSEQPLLLRIFEEGFVPHSETEYLEDVLTFERGSQYLKFQIPIGLLIVSALLILVSRFLTARTDRARAPERIMSGNGFIGSEAAPRLVEPTSRARVQSN